MNKSEFYKNKYKDTWKEGNAREQIVMDLLVSLGVEVEPFGFGALSDQYFPEKPQEAGIPDLIGSFKGKTYYFEVTGTENMRVTPSDKLWFRPDKIGYAKRHSEQVVYGVHVLDRWKLIRFIRLDRAEGEKISKMIRQGDSKYDSVDTFIAIDPNYFLSVLDFEFVKND